MSQDLELAEKADSRIEAHHVYRDGRGQLVVYSARMGEALGLAPLNPPVIEKLALRLGIGAVDGGEDRDDSSR